MSTRTVGIPGVGNAETTDEGHQSEYEAHRIAALPTNVTTAGAAATMKPVRKTPTNMNKTCAEHDAG